jgi:hypothetical protein
VSDVAESAVIRRRTIMAAQGKHRTAQPAPLRMPQQVAPIDRTAMPTAAVSDTSGVEASSLQMLDSLLPLLIRWHRFGSS